MNHEGACWGGHLPEISCEEAELIRAKEEKGIWYCPNSESNKHSFMGGTFCIFDCGRNVIELYPDAFK